MMKYDNSLQSTINNVKKVKKKKKGKFTRHCHARVLSENDERLHIRGVRGRFTGSCKVEKSIRGALNKNESVTCMYLVRFTMFLLLCT